MKKHSITYSSKENTFLSIIQKSDPVRLFTSSIHFFWVILGFMLLSGCGNSEEPDREIVAQYKTYVLYRDELDQFLPFGFENDSLVEKDSSFYAQKYIKKWVKDRVIAEHAYKVINNLETRVEARLDNYRYSLINYEYASWIVDEGLQTEVSDEEIQSFYEENQASFVSKGNYYSYFHVRTGLEAPFKQVSWMRSSNEESIKELEAWCKEPGNVISFKLDSTYTNELELVNAGEGFYGNITKIRLRSVYNYYTPNEENRFYNFIKMLDVIEPGEVKPLELCREEIIQLILQDRRQDLIKQAEAALMKQAENSGDLTF